MKKDLFWDYTLSGNMTKKADDTASIICLGGEADIQIDDMNHHVSKNDLCVVFGGDIYSIKNATPDFECLAFVSLEEFVYNVYIPSFTQIYIYIRKHRKVTLNEEEKQDLLKMYEDNKAFYQREGKFFREESARHRLTAIIYEVMDIYHKRSLSEEKPFTNKDKIYFNFISLIEANCHEFRNIDFYADKLCISSRYLSKICKETVGLTAKQCIDDFVIVGIKMLLNGTTLSVTQISDKMNFTSTSFLVRFFREHTGLTPQQYRKC